MTSTAADIILHHYDASPFSQKVRLFLGLKGARWRSVVTPNMMPKPLLTPLTGGYRRAPVMQVGADVFCDSQAILAEIERRYPSPGGVGAAFPVNLWSDRSFFQATVAVIFGRIGDRIDPAFAADREKLSGRPFDTAAMAAASGPMRGQWRGCAAWLERALADAPGPFLSGEAPGLVDVCAVMNVWWLHSVFPDVAEVLLEGLGRVRDWRARMAEVGHGERVEMTGEEALLVARDAEPGEAPAHDPADPLGIEPGAFVSVAADDYGRDPVTGRLVAAAAERIVIARDTPELGRLHLHFPRVGYMAVAPASGAPRAA